MPIKQIQTTSVMQSSINADADIQLDDEKQAAFYSLMESFLSLNPTPTDEHIHMLATSVGMEPETFEQLIYKFFGSVLHPKDAAEAFLEDDEEEPIDDALHASLMDRIGASNSDDNTFGRVINKQIFDVKDIEPIEAADFDGEAAETDGAPDMEVFGEKDPLKEASENDGAPDEELIQEIEDNQSPEADTQDPEDLYGLGGRGTSH